MFSVDLFHSICLIHFARSVNLVPSVRSVQLVYFVQGKG
jgi:hypothetical protein